MKDALRPCGGIPGERAHQPDELLALECDILVPAALENTIHADNATRCARKIVAEAANGPLTPAADRILESKGVFVIPDILCNAGGVTVSYFEWVQDEQHLFWEAQDVYNRLERVMKTAFRDVLKIHHGSQCAHAHCRQHARHRPRGRGRADSRHLSVKHIHARDVGRGETHFFLRDQFCIATNIITVPIWIAGLYFCLIAPDGKRYRMIAWMYLAPLLLFLFARGRQYYLSPAYPMLLAAGSAWAERWVNTLSANRARVVRRTTYRALAVAAVLVGVMVLPIAPAGSAWWKVADKMNGNFNEEFDWPEMAETAAQIRDSLPAEDRSHLGILTADSGGTGAIAIFGARYGLPAAISGSDSDWLRGYGNPPPSTLIVIGFPKIIVGAFESCEVAGHVTNRYGIENSAIGGYTTIWVCRNLREPWPEFWLKVHSFG
jgi:hypothetical protein